MPIAPWDEPENAIPEPVSKKAPNGNLDPNNANPEKMFSYQEQINEINEQLEQVEDVMFAIIEAYSKSKSAVRLELAENFQKAQDGTKKTAGIEILELYAVSKNEELKKQYQDYIFYETKRDMLSKIMESKKTRISGLQSNMKYDDWRKG